MPAATMGKADVVDAVAEKAGLSKKDAAAAVDAMLGFVVSTLKKGGKIQLTGFGSFEVRKRKARKGKNLQTGETINIPASKVPAFKAGKALKDGIK